MLSFSTWKTESIFKKDIIKTTNMNKNSMAFEAAKNAFCKSMKWNVNNLSWLEEMMSEVYGMAMVIGNGNQEFAVRMVKEIFENKRFAEKVKAAKQFVYGN